MAGKTRGSASSADYFPPSILGVELADVGRGWEAAKRLFDYRKADDALKGMLKHSDLRLAVALFIAGGLLAFVFTMLANLEFLYVLQLEAKMYVEITAQEIPMPDISVMLPTAVAEFVFLAIFMVLANLLLERTSFAIARASGGKATLGEHLTLASVVWLAISITMAANLLGPIGGCLSLVSVAVIAVVGGLYLMTYMTARAYSLAHNITMAHALTISILLAIVRVAIMLFTIQAANSIIWQPAGGG